MLTTSPGCGAIGLRSDITTVTGRVDETAVGEPCPGEPCPVELWGGAAGEVAGVGLLGVAVVGEGLGLTPAAGNGAASASIVAAAASRDSRRTCLPVLVKPCRRAG